MAGASGATEAFETLQTTDRLNKDKPLFLEQPWMTPLKLGKPLKHRQALVARTTLDNVKAKAMAVTKQVPHLRRSQAPPLPWRRPG